MECHPAQEIINKLLAAENVLLLTHQRPDGDALGSTFGMKEFLRSNGVAAEVLIPDGALPRRYTRMFTGYLSQVTAAELDKFDCILALDCANPERLGSGEDFNAADLRKRNFLCIDHHEGNSLSAVSSWISPQSGSTCQMVMEIIDMLDMPTTMAGATFLLTGMMTDTGCFCFSNTTGSALRAAALAVVFLLMDRARKKKGTYEKQSEVKKRLTWISGAFCGVFLCAASALQQFGIASNTGSPGKDAFITALYIVFVPLFGLFLGRRAAPHVYGCVAVALVGLWLLCMNGTSLTTGDIQLIFCSVLFACQMIMVDLVGEHVDAVRLSAVQFLVVGAISLLLAVIFENPTLDGVLTGWWTVLYAGILSSAVAYTLQIVGQQRSPAAVASLVLSLESVVAVIASMVALHLFPTLTEILGMSLIFLAIIVCEIPWKSLKKTAV